MDAEFIIFNQEKSDHLSEQMSIINNQYMQPRLREKERIRLSIRGVDENGRNHYPIVTATVIKVYPHYAVLDIRGKRESYQYWDIWMMRKRARGKTYNSAGRRS